VVEPVVGSAKAEPANKAAINPTEALAIRRAVNGLWLVIWHVPD
jgi:hypothetical protein